jgi:hypothetical protein
MNKEEVIDLMLESINTDNKQMCKNNGLSDEDTQKQIDQSQPALTVITTNLYKRLKESGVIG